MGPTAIKAAIGGGAAAAALLVAVVVWRVVDAPRRAEERARAETGAASPLLLCLDQNLGSAIPAAAHHAIRRACESVAAGRATPEAECVLRSRDAIVNDETMEDALAACGVTPN